MSLLRKTLLTAVLAMMPFGAALAAGDHPGATARPHPAEPASTARARGPQVAGQRAIDLLGGRLPEVAAWYRKSADEFRALL